MPRRVAILRPPPARAQPAAPARPTLPARSPAALKTTALLVALAALNPSSSHARADCIVNRVAQLPVTLWQDKLFIPVTIDGVQRAMFIDTGAAITTLSEDTAATLNLPRDFDHTADMLGIGGKESHLYIAHTKTIALGSQSFTERPFPVAAFAQRLADGSPAGGLVGADLLSRYDLDLDIARRTLGLWQVTGCAEVKPDWSRFTSGIATSAPITILPSRHVTVPVTVDDAPLNLLLDTGSPGLVLSTRAAARAGATPEMLEESRALQGSGVNNRAFTAWLHIFRRLEFAGAVFGDVRAAVVSPGRLQSGGDGLLGVAFLKRGRIWISYATGRLFVE